MGGRGKHGTGRWEAAQAAERASLTYSQVDLSKIFKVPVKAAGKSRRGGGGGLDLFDSAIIYIQL